MNIIYISHYFVPEISAPSARVYELSREWVKRGHHVKVVTCFPNHPTGVIPPEYRGKIFQREVLDDIEVYRSYVFAAPSGGFLKRTIGYVSSMFSSLFLSLPKIRGSDVIIVSSPNFFSVISAYVYSRLRGTPYIFEVRDLWPAIFVELGVLTNRYVIKILESLEMFLYRRASKIVVLTKSFRTILVERGIDPDKIEVVTNGADVDLFKPGEKNNPIRRKYELDNKFVVLYIGAHGISHALESIIEAAELLQAREEIRFLFVGEGAEKDKLVALTRNKHLDNVIFLPGQPKYLVPGFYAASDVCLVPLRDIRLFETFIPSKMFEIMASGRPIIGSVKGEAREILEEAKCALLLRPEDPNELVDAIETLYQNGELAGRLAQNGREFVVKNYSRRELAITYERVLSDVVSKNLRTY